MAQGEKTDWTIEFPTDAAAERALAKAGFSLGTNQRSDPRGIMFGDWNISKWRNLSAADRRDLHGVFQRHGPPGSPTTVTLKSGGAPGRALRAVELAAENA